ncbi:MAG: TIGR03032 family protein [Planctomycetaceae bacterium]|nr:TIGR03032 family protein [Planctomycetaceae bacterium]
MESGSTGSPVVEAHFEATGNFPQLLDQLGVSLLVSTYQAGKVLVLGTHQGELTVRFSHFDRVMGIAVQSRKIAVGSRSQIWYMLSAPELAARIEPAGMYDACYLTRSSHVTGEIQGHEMGWVGDELWVVNTLFSCLSTLDPEYSFVPRWKPPFISNLAAEDRCHLNGMALHGGQPRYVTVMAESNTPGGWRPTKATSGCILDVASGEVVTRGFAMPHSPRVHDGHLWVLDSGHGRLSVIDRASGRADPVAHLPGYTRGLSFYGPYAFIGLSRIRETSVFGGIPIAAHREQLKCGVGIVDVRTGRLLASLYFQSGVTEIFAVEVLPGIRCPSINGPSPGPEEGQKIWYAPGPVPIQTGVPEQVDSRVQNLVSKGDLHRRQGEWAAAASCYRQALQLRPQMPDVARDLGYVLHEQGRYGEAAAVYQEALRLFPDHVSTLLRYGNLLRDAPQRNDEARQQYGKGLEIDPSNTFLHSNLAQLLCDEGDVDQATVHFEESLRQNPVPGVQIASAVMLPPIYKSMEDMTERRQRLINNISQLQKRGVMLDPTRDIVPHLFYPVYQGFNDRELHREFAKLYRSEADVEIPRNRRRDGKIRVGLLSRFFCNHTIGRLNQGLVQQLNRERFHVTVLTTSLTSDSISQKFQEHADNYLVIPEHLPAARKQIAEQGLDILLYADIGMSPFTYSLAFSRLAPVQCVTWGHPQTTGIPTMDYFLSGEHLETDEGDNAYTEKLIRLRGLQTYYTRPVPEEPVRNRDHFNLPPTAHLYGCPQSLFKFHPEFDAVLAGILRGDPQGLLVLLEGKYPQWNAQLLERWKSVMPDVLDRIRFLPRMSRDEFLHLNKLLDVALDPMHFGGGNTTFEALALGTPVVTLPSNFLRGRITYAQYRMMGVTDCIAGSPEEYLRTSLRLGTDPKYREAISQKILETCPILFDNSDNIRAIEEFFTSVAWQ